MTFVPIPDKAVDDILLESDWDTLKDSINKGVARPVAEAVLSVGASSVDITAIAANWSHLLLLLHSRSDTAAGTAQVNLRMNGDTGANYDCYRATQSATPPSTTAVENIAATSMVSLLAIPAATAPANAFGGGVIWVPNYAHATPHKNAFAIGGDKSANTTGNLNVRQSVGWWRNTAAITQLTLIPSAGNFIAGTRVTLYGLGGI